MTTWTLDVDLLFGLERTMDFPTLAESTLPSPKSKSSLVGVASCLALH